MIKVVFDSDTNLVNLIHHKTETMKDFRIEIPKPCRAGWENMEAAEKGRFCGECSKIVIDFTAMSTDEIKDCFLGHKDQKICGHFIASQISRKKGRTETLLLDLQLKSEKIKYRFPRIAASFLLITMLTLIGCRDHSDDHDKIQGEMEVVDGGAMMVADSALHYQDSIAKFNHSDSLKR